MVSGISVIIPTWNRANDLILAIQSALNQSLPPLEILVCDDGSTDQSYSLIKNLNRNTVRWLEGKHSGLPAVARNRGLRQASGDWIAFLDSDDTWAQEKLRLQMEAVQTKNVLASCSNAVCLRPNEPQPKKLLERIEPCLLGLKDILKVNEIITSSAFIHRSLLQKVNSFPQEQNLRALEDYAFWLRICSLTSFAYLPEPLVHYRDDPQTSIRSLDSNPSFPRQKRTVLRNFLRWAFRAGAFRSSKDAFFEYLKTFK